MQLDTLKDLESLIKMMRQQGVQSLKLGDNAVVLGALPPPTPGPEAKSAVAKNACACGHNTGGSHMDGTCMKCPPGPSKCGPVKQVPNGR